MNDVQKSLVASLRSHDLPAVRAMLRAHPDAATSAGVVCEAARLGWTDALALLCRHGADPNAVARGYRPLHALIQERPHGSREPLSAERVACLRWLLDHGANPDSPGAWPPARAILTAAFVGDPLSVRILREGGATVNGFVLAALGDATRVRTLIGKDPGFVSARDGIGGMTALQCSAASRMGVDDPRVARALLTIAASLLDGGADLAATTKGWDHELDAVYFAVSAGNRDLFELLLQRGANPTAALAPAVWKDVALADMALAHGAMLDQAWDSDRPLLNNLVRWGQVRPALWMLEKGVDPNLVDALGWTAVHQAASRGNERILKAVLAAGGDPRRAAIDGMLPIDIARAARKPKIVALLTP